MKEYKMNYELSKEVFDKYKRHIKKQECYSNCYNLAVNEFELGFFTGGCRLGYCYMDIGFVGLLVRHCVLITAEDELIDATSLLVEEKPEKLKERKYYVFETLDDNEVYEMICETGFADNSNSKVELKEYQEFFKDNMFLTLNENDFFRYIFPKLRKEQEEKYCKK